MTPLSPKDRFLQLRINPEKYRSVVEDDGFQDSLNVVMLEFIHELSPSQNNEEAAANHWRLEGARKLIRILLTLADNKAQEKPANPGALKFDQK